MIVEREAWERDLVGAHGHGGAEIGAVAGGAVGEEDGLAFSDDFRLGGPVMDERGVIEGGERFLEFGGLGLLDGDDFLFYAFLRGLEGVCVVIKRPVADEPDDGSVEGEEPPVREFLVVFLDAVVFVFAEDDLAWFGGEVGTPWLLVPYCGSS